MSIEQAERGMTETEAALADEVYAAIQRMSNYSERSQQSSDFRIGISDLGYCSEKVRRMVAGVPEPATDKLPAFIGTALGDYMEQACTVIWPRAIRQPTVHVTLHGDGGDYVVTGHPDMVRPEGVVVDFKSARGLSVARRTGPSQQQQFQRHCYALGAFEAGLFDASVGIEDVQVANVWMDRAGDEHHLFVHMEPFSFEVIEAAAMWVDDVAYAYLNDTEARKEPPREVCAATCGHFETCRALDTDVEGLLTDDAVVAAIDMHREGIALVKQGEKLKDQAKAHLAGVSGSTGKFSVRWVHVNGGQVNYTRSSYDRLDVREV